MESRGSGKGAESWARRLDLIGRWEVKAYSRVELAVTHGALRLANDELSGGQFGPSLGASPRRRSAMSADLSVSQNHPCYIRRYHTVDPSLRTRCTLPARS